MSRGMNWTPEQVEEYQKRAEGWKRPALDGSGAVIPEQAKAQSPQEVKKVRGLPPEPNQTEARFRDEILIAERGFKPKNIIYQPGRFLLPTGNNWYSPDWSCSGSLYNGFRLLHIFEVKGPHKHSRDSEFRFKWARHAYGGLRFRIPGWEYEGFTFEAWQWKNRTWKEIWK